MKPLNRRWLTAVALGALLATGAAAQVGTATRAAECCLSASSALSAYLNPPLGEDNAFFRQAAGGDATLTFVLMNRRQMLWFPRSLYELRLAGSADGSSPDDASATGCQNRYLNELQYFYRRASALSGPYTPTRTYPRPEVTYAASSVNTNAVRDLFDPAKFYKYLTWTSTGTSSAPSSNAATACNGLSGLSATQKTECASCLATRGYYLNPTLTTAADSGQGLVNNSSAGVFAGNWLNFHPPRYVMLRLALKRMIGDPRISRFRISVVTNANDQGAVIREAFRPSCNGNGTPTNSFTNGVDSVAFDQTSNPLAEVLFNMGEFHADAGRWYGGGQALFLNSGVQKITDRGNLCRDCDQHFIALFSDGRGDEGTPYCTPVLGANGALAPPRPCTRAVSLSCADVTGATVIEGDGDHYVSQGRWGVLSGLLPRTPAGTCASDVADDVAGFLDRTDLGVSSALPGQNTVQTYTIGVGANTAQRMNILRSVAERGGGEFYLADDYDALERGLDGMLTQMLRRSTSFSSAAVSTFQVNSNATGLIPRFRPARGADWRGYLYRWSLFSEFVEGVNRNASTEDPDDLDDVFLTDPQGHIVTEDDDGIFVRQGTREPATPHWEAGVQLVLKGADRRTLYTVIDTGSANGPTRPDGRLDHHDTRVAFTVANAAQLAPYLGLEGSPVCGTLQVALGVHSLSQLECARHVIQYVRGKDVLDEDGDLDHTDDREWLLGDIFHSSPVLVSNPVDPFLCDLGLHPQCANTLYARDLPARATPLTSYTVGGGRVDAYGKYRQDQQSRERIVLVGANDGMVHAFHAGSVLSPLPTPSTEDRFPETHDLGTGEELWAFIPPDLLPKLKFRLNDEGRHHYFVDGDTMVRDIWADSATHPGAKDAEEFHTLAIFSERRGGNHYFALDVTSPRDPKFRWLFPQPCSPEAQEVGETWMGLSPKPPPVGPVLLKKAEGAPGAIARVIPPVTTAVPTEERWAVFLQGGHDVNLNRGRGVYVLDVYSGQLLYKHQYDARVASTQQLKYPIAAPVALVDYGGGGASQDGFFDTALLADTGGQVHVLRFQAPGEDVDRDGLIDTWHLARSFEQGASSNADLRERNPFFFISSNAIDPETGQLRTFLGGGDRYNVRDPGAGECKVDNPQACGRQGCTYQSTFSLTQGSSTYSTGTTLSSQRLTSVSETGDSSAGLACQGFTGSQVDTVSGCSGVSGTRVLKSRTVSCGTDGGTYGCSNDLASLDGGVYDVAPVGTASTTGQARNRYYGFWSYGQSTELPDGGTWVREFSDPDGAAAFDRARLRDADLVDVTAGTAQAASGANGWRLEYAAHAERTASGSGILASCVLWNSMQFVPDGGTGCSVGGSNLARFYQANILTGAADCADSFKTADGSYVRSLSRSVMTPPPEPIPKVSINREGQIRYSLDSFDPGAAQAQSANVQSSADMLQLIYTLDVPPDLHACRHTPSEDGVEGRCR